MGFPRQEYWNELPFSSPGELSDTGIEPSSLASQTDSLPAEPQGRPKSTGVGSLSLLEQIFLTQVFLKYIIPFFLKILNSSLTWSPRLTNGTCFLTDETVLRTQRIYQNRASQRRLINPEGWCKLSYCKLWNLKTLRQLRPISFI